MKKLANVNSDGFILLAVERAVEHTGYPVTGQVLKSIGVDRTQIRQLERKGLLMSMNLSISGQHTKAYYTERVYPSNRLFKQ